MIYFLLAFYITSAFGEGYEVVGGGPCIDVNGGRPPYCNLAEDIYDLSACQALCDDYIGCQALLHADYWGCRFYFNTWENAQAMLPLSSNNDDCYDQDGGEVTSGEQSNCGDDGYCCYKNMKPTECTMAMAECCDVDGSCTDGDDDYCCNGVFYCSNDSLEYAQALGGILCPSGVQGLTLIVVLALIGSLF